MKTRINNQTKIADNEQLTLTHLCNNQTVPECSYTGNRNRPNEPYHLYRGAMDSSDHILKFSFETAVFLLSMAMRILFSTFWFAIFVYRVLKCEAVIFDKYSLACVNGTSISNFWPTRIIRAGSLPVCVCRTMRA